MDSSLLLDNDALIIGVPKGIRTPVAAVKGQCPRPLDDGDVLEGRYSTINFHLYIKKIVFPLFLVSKLASNLPLFVLGQAKVVYTP